MRSRFVVALVTTITLASPLVAGPPWISVEVPPNPFDRASRGAFLLVHTFHYGRQAQEQVAGRAITVAGGQRRTVNLAFESTSRPGVFAVRNSWGETGDWVLLITNQQAGHNGGAAEVMVRVSGNRVVGVEAATKPSQWAELPLEPRRFTEAEVDAALRKTS